MSLLHACFVLGLVIGLLTVVARLWSRAAVQRAQQAALETAGDVQARVATLVEQTRSLGERLELEARRRADEVAEWSERLERSLEELAAERQLHATTAGHLQAQAQTEIFLSQSVDQERQRAALLDASLDQERADNGVLRERLAELQAVLEGSREKLTFLDEARKLLGEQMKLIATEVVEKSGKQLNESQHEKLAALLSPVKETFEVFTKKVEATELKRAEEQGKLGEQLQQLMKASTDLDKGARELTVALKGDNKVAGDWGETTLARVLECAGLEEGRAYVTQQSHRDDEGNLLRPDVVVRLPGDKNLVIDSKVSLKPWTAYSAENSDLNWAAVVSSVRTHYQALAKKSYASLYGLTTVDFVLMFIPTEGAFLELVRREPALLQDAWQKRVMFVGPSNLQWALRMVASLWRFEDQSQNAREIAQKAGEMYDKFVGFVEDLEKIGKCLNGAVDSYNKARRKLDTGRGHLVGRAEGLRELGVVPKKQLPEVALMGDYADGVALPSVASLT